MALIDLSKFQPNVLQDNRQRQQFGGEGLAMQGRALERLGQVATSAVIDATDRERKAALAKYHNDAVNTIMVKESQFESDWEKISEAGNYKDDKGRTYTEAKDEFYTNVEKDVKTLAGNDSGMFKSFSNKFEELKAKSKVNSVLKTVQNGKDATTINFKKSAIAISNKIAIMDHKEIAKYWNEYASYELENNLRAGKEISGSHSLQEYEAAKSSIATKYKEKITEMEIPAGVSPIEVVKDVVPLSVYWSEDYKAYRVERMGEILAGNPEEAVFAMRNIIENDKKLLQLGSVNLLKKYEKGLIDHETYKKISEKLEVLTTQLEESYSEDESGNAKMINKPIDIGASLTEEEAKALNGTEKSYELFHSMGASDRIDLISTLERRVNTESRETLAYVTTRIADLKALPMSVGESSKLTYEGLSRTSYAPAELLKLRQQYPKQYAGAYAARDIAEAQANKILFDLMQDPNSTALKGGNFAAKIITQARQYVYDNGDDDMRRAVLDPGFASSVLAPLNKKLNDTYRKSVMSYNTQDRAKWAMMYSTKNTVNMFRKAFTPDGINPKGMKDLESFLTRNDSALLMPQNKDKFKDELSSMLITGMERQVRNDMANGMNPADAWKKVYSTMPPSMKAHALEFGRVMGKDNLLMTAYVVDALSDRLPNEIQGAIVESNSTASLKEIEEEKKKSQSFADTYVSISEAVGNYIAERSEGVEGRTDTRIALQKTITNWIALEVKKNPSIASGDLAETVKRELSKVYDTTISSSGTIGRGFFKKKKGETQDEFDTKIENIRNKMVDDIYKGKLSINFNNIPMNPDERKIISGMKSTAAVNYLLNRGYNIRVAAPDEFGGGRKYSIMLEDKKTKTLHPLQSVVGYNLTGEIE